MTNVSARSLLGSVGVSLALAIVWALWLSGAAPVLAGFDSTYNSQIPLQHSSLNRGPLVGAAALPSDSDSLRSTPQGGRFAVSNDQHRQGIASQRPTSQSPSDTPDIPAAWWVTVQAYFHAYVAASLPPQLALP